ncbi:Na+/H+ antiporter [Paenibacillus selenitireducens]|uniref:Na+/H+ antiporter n=1 Tax=Paenibacillus selenitireducens TaxID=1324314 RepID=A0A1T2X050_9BACL|nr:Na+/H+ antiporter [Paenibacillus selenitireducens]OPA73247.1 Na+/H+ antiporter [Paenibacillus selenitireducens]
MHFLILLIALTLVVVTATVLNRRFPKIPVALFQIAIGAVVSWLPLHLSLTFEPEAFMVCIIAPLLFGDGRAVSRVEMWKYKTPILLMSLGLVLITVIGIGYVIHYLIPSMPLAAAFALAAILSPTDAVAVKSITKGMSLPKGLMPILEGESLLNDAAGIVSFKVALAVVLTGVFSVQGAAINFIFVAIGGVIAGFLLGGLFVKLRLSLRKYGFEEVNTLVVIQLITPFVIYLLAEELHVSGILAVVTAGIIHGIERDRLQQTTTKLQIISSNTWSVLSYILNGFVFVLLGFLLPDAYRGMVASHEVGLSKVLLLTLLIAIGLFVIRYIWVLIFHKKFNGREKVSIFEQIFRGSKPVNELPEEHTPRGRYAFIAATCGIHGTITLATALSIPYELSAGIPFPLRDTIIFISAGVILISLIYATIALPFFNAKGNVETTPDQEFSWEKANQYVISKSIQLLGAEATPENQVATNMVLKGFSEQLAYAEQGGVQDLSEKKIREIRQIAMDAERNKCADLIREGRISPQMQSIYDYYHQRREQYTLLSNLRRGLFHIKMYFVKRRFRKLAESKKMGHKAQPYVNQIQQAVHQFREIEHLLYQEAIDAIKAHRTKENSQEALFVMQHYARRMQQLSGQDVESEKFQHQLTQVNLRGIQIKRDLVQELEDEHKVSAKTALELRQHINYDEMLLLDEGEE